MTSSSSYGGALVSYAKIKSSVDKILSGNVDLNSMTVKMLRLKVAEVLGVTKKEVDKSSIKRAFREIALGTAKTSPKKADTKGKKETKQSKNTTSQKKKRKRTQLPGKSTASKNVSRSKSWKAITKMIREAGIGPTIYQNLPKDTASKESELVRRIRSRGFQIRGAYPSPGEITAATQARALKLSLDGIDTSNIIEGSGKRRRKRTVRSSDFVDPETHVKDEEAGEASEDDAFEDKGGTSPGKRGGTSRSRKVVIDDDSEEEFAI